MSPPSPKRFRELSFVESATATPRLSDSPLRMLQIIDKRFERQTVELHKQLQDLFKESEARLLNQLEKSMCEKINEMRADLDNVLERVKKLESEVALNKNTNENKILDLNNIIANAVEKTNNLKTVCGQGIDTELTHLRQKIQQYENTAVACDLRIDGIPYVKNENLNAVFFNMCSSLSIETPNVRTIYRLKTKTFLPAPTILVKLWSPYDKNFVLKTVTNYRRQTNDLLRLYLLNFDANNPFYVNENLSQSNYKTFNKALKMKKERKLCSVFTIRGIVHVRKNEADEPIRIDDIELLENLFRDDGKDAEML